MYDGWRCNFQAFSNLRVFWGTLYRGKGLDNCGLLPVQTLIYGASSLQHRVIKSALSTPGIQIKESPSRLYVEYNSVVQMLSGQKSERARIRNSIDLSVSHHQGRYSVCLRPANDRKDASWGSVEHFPSDTAVDQLADIVISKLDAYYTSLEADSRQSISGHAKTQYPQ